MAGTFLCFGLLVMMCDVPLPLPSPGPVVVCPPLVEIPADLQRRVADELAKLPPGAALNEFVVLSVRQRDVVRRCNTARTQGKKAQGQGK